jgi:hypothetical protein
MPPAQARQRRHFPKGLAVTSPAACAYKRANNNAGVDAAHAGPVDPSKMSGCNCAHVIA